MTISAAGGGSPGSLGSSPGAPSGIDDPAWDGYYIWSTTPSGAGAAGPSSYLHWQIRHQSGCGAGRRSCRAYQVSGSCGNAGANQERNHHQRATFSGPRVCAPQAASSRDAAARACWTQRAHCKPLDRLFVVTPPANVTVAAGATASFAVEAIGAVSLSMGPCRRSHRWCDWTDLHNPGTRCHRQQCRVSSQHVQLVRWYDQSSGRRDGD